LQARWQVDLVIEGRLVGVDLLSVNGRESATPLTTLPVIGRIGGVGRQPISGL